MESVENEKQCAGCGKEEGKQEGGEEVVDLKMCSRCKKVYYCSRECQKKNYRVHKRYCISISQEEASATPEDSKEQKN
jgi:hypothetical protein